MTDDEFPNSLWPEIQAQLAEHGIEGVLELLSAEETDDRRLTAYGFALNALANRDWPGKNLDVVVAVGDAAIAHCLQQAEAATDATERSALVDRANIASYNLSAGLADCWPGDEIERQRRHFARGLEAAEACLAWRRELGKGAFPFSIAHWAEGMHCVSLGEHARARDAFRASLEYAETAAKDEGKPTDLGADSTFSIALAHGYLGLAEALAGEAAGRERFERAIAVFTEQVGRGGEVGDDAQFGIDQLREVERRYGGEG